MFDMLTRDQLYALHTSLFRQHTALNAIMIGEDCRLRISPLSETWDILDAKCCEITEMMAAIGDELDRRAALAVRMAADA